MANVADLSAEIARQLSLYSAALDDEIEIATDEVTKEAVKELQQTSPKLTGDYAKGWTRRKGDKGIVVYNKTDYRLTHLLEHGHAKAGGGRVAARPHIRQVEEKAVREFVRRIEGAAQP
ncbi:HK97 gp10 family phage protein [Brevibacillus agri]|uniref:HK97 gp10 family phage protein n=1 Tax=Brevibacillus agri TaxID=51101 RepID=UPI0018CEA264|nr:HK97 gp10 family phage protein [Brevibacillus agri]MBG9567564.1 prophage pi2 protein 37 [Brevibacillus agri]MBG9567593.1 prophage pi2 protein 37 [Brevibacillus agri]MED1642299.1 HK97 gp10 family phage protein [Brevibacillus agri]MED1657720.1 HK97 gp10 family phage protein [Brevibacillus agri]MED1689477.1 HK97 gp10 family phage protein [Brevibacillus agri]